MRGARDSESSPFHEVGQLFPGEFDLLTLAPGTPVETALERMSVGRYSQAPVVGEDGRVRGTFSCWSLASHLLDAPRVPISDLVVDDVMEQIPTITVDDALDEVIALLKRHDAVLVQSPHGPQAIATSTDVLNYFYDVARPYLLLKEIELALRSLIESCLTGAELEAFSERALRSRYDSGSGTIPKRLSEMSFEDYRMIVVAKGNWERFQGVLGQNKRLVSSKLEMIRRIRNDVFHFRDAVSVRDHEKLVSHRNWLLEKTTTHERELREERLS